MYEAVSAAIWSRVSLGTSARGAIHLRDSAILHGQGRFVLMAFQPPGPVRVLPRLWLDPLPASPSFFPLSLSWVNSIGSVRFFFFSLAL